jgi:cbb3-type cytochrome oxidase subunit 3
MLRTLLADVSLLELPIVAMVLFLLLFLAVLWRVAGRSRREVYARMARLPLDDGRTDDQRSHP